MNPNKPKEIHTRHLIVKLVKTNYKNSGGQRMRDDASPTEETIQMTPDFSSETMKAKRK